MNCLLQNGKYLHVSKVSFSRLCCKKVLVNKRQKSYFSSSFNKPKFSKIEWRGIFLLAIPVGSFYLGCWQVQRRKWKLGLIEELNTRVHTPSVPFPERLEDLEDMEYKKVTIFGRFEHDKEMYLGPRSLIVNDERKQRDSVLFTGSSGFNVITPFRLSSGDFTILANRGWVSSKEKNPALRLKGQISDEIELTGVVRKHENRAQFMPENRIFTNDFFYRDVQGMSEKTGCSPVFVDIVETVPGGPVGSQTKVTLRNEHLSYLLTWYSLSFATSVLWYWRFIKRKPLM